MKLSPRLLRTDGFGVKMIDEPLTFAPIFKTRVWGGDFLRRRLPAHSAAADNPAQADAPLGESWEICDHDDDVSVVRGGNYDGKTLREILFSVCGNAVDPANPRVFPLILKLIDARENLSVQVHPDDQYASAQKAGELGKAEAWYVIDAEPDAKLYLGLRAGVSREKFVAAIAENRVAECLREWTVKRGDVFYVPSGVFHAIGAGLRVFEIHQNSDATYRVFDWQRGGSQPRELHLDNALAAADFSGKIPAIGQTRIPHAACRYRRVVACEKFKLDVLDNFSAVFAGDTQGRSFQILTVVAGEATIQTRGGTLVLRQYDSGLLPIGAGAYAVFPRENLELLIFSR